MKTKDIVIGKSYYVRIPKEVDEYLHMCDSPNRPRAWAPVRIHATVLEVGVARDVPEFQTYGGLAGTPRVHSGSHHIDDGVRIRFEYRGDERTVVVPPRAIQWEEAA